MSRSVVDRYRCRSAYKLIELDDRYHFLKQGSIVVSDCCIPAEGPCRGPCTCTALQIVLVQVAAAAVYHVEYGCCSKGMSQRIYIVDYFC